MRESSTREKNDRAAEAQGMSLRYRLLGDVPTPRPARLGEIGGALDFDLTDLPRPSQCPVFVEGSTYGVELLYPFKFECRVSLKNGAPCFEGDFGEAPNPYIPWPPIRWVNPEHYSILMCVDIVPDAGYAIRIEPHARYFNDRTGRVPAAVIGNIDTAKWPMYMFLTFKAPLPGNTHVLKYMDPLAQLLSVPINAKYLISEMSAGEKNLREELARTLSQNRDSIATRTWVSRLGHRFDNLYRLMTSRKE